MALPLLLAFALVIPAIYCTGEGNVIEVSITSDSIFFGLRELYGDLDLN